MGTSNRRSTLTRRSGRGTGIGARVTPAATGVSSMLSSALKGHAHTISHSFAEERSVAARRREWEDVARRALDLVVAGSTLLVLLPVLLLVGLLVKLDSPGPVLFRHQRVGLNRRKHFTRGTRSPERRKTGGFGRPFELFKFRTMYEDARERYPHLYLYDYSEEELRTLPIKVLVAQKWSGGETAAGRSPSPGKRLLGKDPRVTRVGQWLRRTSLDEIPNLLNVLTGDMHLVGPRPDIVENLRYYRPEELRILDVKPGVTGLAQIRGRGFLTFEQTNAFDVEYLEHRSLWTDLRILAQTMPALMKRHGAY